MESLPDFTDLIDDVRELRADTAETGLEFLLAVREHAFGRPDRKRKRHEMLLHAVVEIALDALPCFISRGHDPRARCAQRRLILGIRDCGRDELSEPAQAHFGIRRERIVRRRRSNHDPPKPPVNDDRRADGRARTEGERSRRRFARILAEGIQPRRASGGHDERRDVPTAKAESRADRNRHAGATPGPNNRQLVARVVPIHRRELGVEKSPSLLANEAEDLLGRGTARHAGGNSTEGSLVFGDRPQFDASVRVCDRGRNELRERAQPRFAIRRQWIRGRGCEADDAPELSADADRHADRRTHLSSTDGESTADLIAIVGACRSPRSQDERVNASLVVVNARAHVR